MMLALDAPSNSLPSILPPIPTHRPFSSSSVTKDIRIVHKSADVLGISLVEKKTGGCLVKSAPNHKNHVRRGMSLISVNNIDVTTHTLLQIVQLLGARPLDLLFRPAPPGPGSSSRPKSPDVAATPQDEDDKDDKDAVDDATSIPGAFSVTKDIRIVHRSPDLLGIALVEKKKGGCFIRSAPKYKRHVRRGMTLMSINKKDVSTLKLQEIVVLLKARPLDLVFRPAPKGVAVTQPDPNAPPPRPSLEERVSAIKDLYRERRKQSIKQKHLSEIQRYRIGAPFDNSNPKEVQMCDYRNTVVSRRELKKKQLKDRYFYNQWLRRSAGYRQTLALVFDAMDVDKDGTLTR